MSDWRTGPGRRYVRYITTMDGNFRLGGEEMVLSIGPRQGGGWTVYIIGVGTLADEPQEGERD